MKAPTPPPPPPDPQPQTYRSAADDERWNDGPNPLLKSEYRRHILRHWSPTTMGQAKEILEESVSRAQSLTSILMEYTYAIEKVSYSDMRQCLALVDDLLFFGYGMIEWWEDEAELIKDGWTPPQGKAVQP